MFSAFATFGIAATFRRALSWAAAGCMGASVAPWAAAQDASPPLPQHLNATGLYVADSGTQVQDDVYPFAPQYPLWSDGASKRRWIQLPPGTAIDASDPDAWQFPLGTRLWKEFAHGGRPIETRMIERLANGEWRFATYVWNLQGTDALLAPARGVRQLAAADAPGGVYAVPSQADCRVCHEGGASPVLGFSALQLSPDRDPNAAHTETPPPQHLDLSRAQTLGLLRYLPAALRDKPPRIAAPDATARAALGYLHANCGHCHNDTGPLASLDMALHQRTDDPVASAGRSWRSLSGTASRYQRAASERQTDRLAQRVDTGNADASMVLQRMRSEQAARRMPPLGVAVPDAEGMALIRRWIVAQANEGATNITSNSNRNSNDRFLHPKEKLP